MKYPNTPENLAKLHQTSRRKLHEAIAPAENLFINYHPSERVDRRQEDLAGAVWKKRLLERVIGLAPGDGGRPLTKAVTRSSKHVEQHFQKWERTAVSIYDMYLTSYFQRI